jgi:hypothetical protein
MNEGLLRGQIMMQLVKEVQQLLWPVFFMFSQ